MKSYKFLKVLSGIIQVIAVLTLALGIVFFIYLLLKSSERQYDEFTHDIMVQNYNDCFFLLFGSVIAFLILMAISQFIKLMINVADDISTIATNAYVIAQKSLEKKIDENEL